jgi:hypothetical protein
MIASRTITNASNFMLSSFVQEIKVLNFLPIMPVLSGIAEVHLLYCTEKIIEINYCLFCCINYSKNPGKSQFTIWIEVSLTESFPRLSPDTKSGSEENAQAGVPPPSVCEKYSKGMRKDTG